MSKRAVLVLDQGTTSSRALLLDRGGKVLALAQQEFTQYFPRSGWVEHDALEIWESQLACARQVLEQANLHADEIAAVGITNQRETTVVWDRRTGAPLQNAIVWQDRRTASFCDQLKRDGHGEIIRLKTGLIPDAYFSGSKINWILEHVPGARRRAERGELAFGTVDSWLIWKLTEGVLHATDATNASRTMLYDIHAGVWDETLLALLDVPAALLPDVRSSSDDFSHVHPRHLGAEIPITGVAGDQQAALFGQLCVKRGMVKNTYGTGCFMMMNTGSDPVHSRNNLLTTLAWQLDGVPTYALEGSIFMGGAVVQWLRDGLQLIRQSADVEDLARSVKDNGGVYFVPAFTGLGAPHWDPYARGTLVGLSRGSTRGHIARAALEAIAFQNHDVLDAMQADADMHLTELRVDGGASANNLLMQFQSDLLGVDVVRPRNLESTALGAGFLAGLAVHFWPDIAALQEIWQEEHRFTPQSTREEMADTHASWERAVQRARGWAQE